MAAPISITAALNGTRPAGSHPRLPLSPAALAADALAVVAAGAGAVHVRVRDEAGALTFDPDSVAASVGEIRRACPEVAIGVGTAGPSGLASAHRAELVRDWEGPSFASVRLSEPDHLGVMAAVLDAALGLAACVATPGDVHRLIRTGLSEECTLVMIGPDPDAPGGDQVVLAAAIERALDAAAIHAPRLHHGSDAQAWDVLRAAVALGRDVRVGLADTFQAPDGRLAASNAALVRAARKLIKLDPPPGRRRR